MLLRIDLILVNRGLAKSRTQAQGLVADGRVFYRVPGQEGSQSWSLVSKPSHKISEELEIKIVESDKGDYVSRGALKIKAAIEAISFPVEGCIAVDVGQSTGGFTDYLLQKGAQKVVGIEVGRNQLAESLRRDERVVCLEGVNARSLPVRQLLEHTKNNAGFDLGVMDVSFISQTLILPSLVPLLGLNGTLVGLVKPQFELGRKAVGKGGIVRDKKLYGELEKVIRQNYMDLGMVVTHYMESPISGGDGNQEFLICASRS